MPQRKCNKTKVKVAKPCKCITLPVKWEEYENIVDDNEVFRQWLNSMMVRYPELFPAAIEQGYILHDKRSSQKMPEVSMRRIKLKSPDEKGKDIVVTIAPSAVMPYMTGYTGEVEKSVVSTSFWCTILGLDLCFRSR